MVGVDSVANGGQRAKLVGQVIKAFARLTILDLDMGTSMHASELGGALRRDGKSVGADAITAAIALAGGCDGVVTRNVRQSESIGEVSRLDVLPY